MWEVSQAASRTVPRAAGRTPGPTMMWRAMLIALLVVTVATTEQAKSQASTEWGDPDLQGIWSNATLTPLERPKAFAEQPFLTEGQVQAIEKAGIQLTVLNPFDFEVPLSGDLNEIWLEPGHVVRSRRTSLVIDPPDGKVPFTPQGRERRDLALARIFGGATDSWEDRVLEERCLASGTMFLPNPFYLNNHHILQSRDHVAIVTEAFNDFRIIPLDGRPPLHPEIQQWAGNSRGRWEGETLVIETANFNMMVNFQGATDGLRIVERITRVDADTIDYELTASDPASFTRAWTLANTLRRIDGPIFEYACHEGNYGLRNILSGARAEEKAAAERTPESE